MLPKPMIEIGGRPLLWHLMKFFTAQGFEEFTVALGYKAEVIKRYFLHYPQLEADFHLDFRTGTVSPITRAPEPWRISLVDTGKESMTGGRLKRLAAQIDGTFFFTYGDGLADVDLQKLLAFHRSHGKLATLTAVRPAFKFGMLRLGPQNEVRAFREKPEDQDGLINGGFFVLEPAVLDFIDGDQTAWEREPCERLAAQGQLMAYRHDGYWQCVDTLHELRLLRDMWDRGAAPWKIW